MTRGPSQRRERLAELIPPEPYISPPGTTAQRTRPALSPLALQFSFAHCAVSIIPIHIFSLSLCIHALFLRSLLRCQLLVPCLSLSRRTIHDDPGLDPFTRDTHETTRLELPAELLCTCLPVYLDALILLRISAISDLPRGRRTGRPSPALNRIDHLSSALCAVAGMLRAAVWLDRHVRRIAAVVLPHASPSPRTL